MRILRLRFNSGGPVITRDINQIRVSLPHELTEAVEAALTDWQDNQKAERLWARDASLWTNNGEDKWLGWLDVVHEQQKTIARFRNFAIVDRKSTRLNSSHVRISYAVFCLKKKKNKIHLQYISDNSTSVSYLPHFH